MNIFVLHDDPVKAAQMMCDKHILKMILETRELLTLAFIRVNGSVCPAKLKGHYNHPCAKWAAASEKNFLWLWEHGKALCDEYTHRYGKKHKYETWFKGSGCSKLVDIVYAGMPFPQKERTPFVQCMLPEYLDDDPIEAYRNYYMGAKTHLLKYTRRSPPDWMQDMQLGEHRDNATV